MARTLGAWGFIAFAMVGCSNAAMGGDAGDAASAMDASADAVSAMDAQAVDAPRYDVQTIPYDVPDPFNDPDARSPATAITAPNEQWTWVDFPDAVCGNGVSTGIGVSLSNRSSKVLIYLQGGGACWEYLTCFQLGSAANFQSGYTATDFNQERGSFPNVDFFNRDDPNNPFRDASFVYVPYCTGDVHSGNRVTSFSQRNVQKPAFFVGARNIDVYLRRLVPTFSGASRVWLAGSSAGGFGAGINWERVQTAFGSTRVDLIDDSGPPMATTRWSMWRSTWNAQVPPGCTACTTDVAGLIDYYNGRYGADHRFALLSYTQDQTISFYFGLSQAQFETEFTALRQRFGTLANMHYFAKTGTDHVLLYNFGLTTGGTTLGTWLNDMVTDAPGWANVGP